MSRKLWLGLAVFGAMLAYGQSGAPSRAGIKIMVPALVESKAGEVAYGLSGDNFLIKDDGIEQRVDLESDPGAQPLSLLLVILTGHNAAAQLGNIARLDDLLDSILTSPRDQVGIITFDGRPRLVQDFTTDSEAVSNSLSTIEPGNANAAFFDAIHMAVAALRKTLLFDDSITSRRNPSPASMAFNPIFRAKACLAGFTSLITTLETPLSCATSAVSSPIGPAPRTTATFTSARFVRPTP